MDIPADVSRAIGQIQIGGGSFQDYQTVRAFMIDNITTLDADTVDMLMETLSITPSRGVSVGNPMAPSYPSEGSGVLPGLATPTITGTPTPMPSGIIPADITGGGVPALPTPAPGGGIQIPMSPNDPSLRGPQGVNPIMTQPRVHGAMASISPEIEYARGGHPDMPSMPPVGWGSMRDSPAGVGASNPQQRAARMEARMADRPQGAPTDWKGISRMGEGSAFANVDPTLLPVIAKSPDLAAALMGAQHGGGERYTRGIAPFVGGAMSLGKVGLLGGSKGPGLGNVPEAKALGRAEDLINTLGPGEYVDPASVLRQTVHKLQNTPEDRLGGDVVSQVGITNDALLGPAKSFASQEDYAALENMLADAGIDYLTGYANGNITMSYPAWLKTQRKAQNFFGR